MLENLDKEQIKSYFLEDTKKERCGVIINKKGKPKFLPIKNISCDPRNEFLMCPKEYSNIEEDIIAIVHSHIDRNSKPSPGDKIGCERSNLIWYIYSTVTDTFDTLSPEGYEIPLKGRQFIHGILDCYSLIYDYYNNYLDINIPDFHRDEFWWNKGMNTYLDNYSKAGFSKVNELQEHDVILIQLESRVPNHGAIYVGNTRILHHPMNRLSHETVYGGYWKKNTWCYLRHEQFI